MTAHGIQARAPRGDVVLPAWQETPESRLVDAAYYPGGSADAFYLPRTEGEIAAIVRGNATVLAVGAQSSLTGGATPTGGALVALDRLDAFAIDAAHRTVRCGAGVVLSRLRDAALDHDLFLAPAPTFDGATIGGMIATNAAGAATFKHGATRDAVRALTIVLADGSVLDVERGAVRAHADGWFEIAAVDGTVRRVPVPRYRLPDVPKCSAGYFAAPGMDLVDLFVGSEGTLGVVVEAVLDLKPRPAATATCWLPVDDEERGIAIAQRLRDASRETWRTEDPTGLDVPSIEHLDRRCLELLRAAGEDAKQRIALDADSAMALVFEVALAKPTTADDALDQLASPGGGDEPLRRLVRVLARDFESLEAALPGETSKAARILAMREAVPTCVNHRVRDARLSNPFVQKVAGDFIVPWNRFAESMRLYRRAFESRRLDYAIWGHISDGNVHPNVIPRSAKDVAVGKEALLELGAEVVRLGGSPLAEHGVGRNPVKQELVRLLHGEAGIEQMRATKRALDPAWKLAPGVIFPQ